MHDNGKHRTGLVLGVGDVKRIPEIIENHLGNNSNLVIDGEDTANVDNNNEVYVPSQEEVPERPKREIRKPNRFNDMVLYYIFD